MDQPTLNAINAKLKSDFKLVKQFGDGNSNKNYLLEDPKNIGIVVKQLDNQPIEFVPIEISIQKHLRKNGMTTPHSKEFSNKGDYILNVGGKNFTYSEYIKSDESLPTPFDLGVNIARFQIAMSDFRAALPPNWLHPAYWDNLKFNNEDLQIATHIRNDVNKLRGTLSKLNLPTAVIHGDLNLGNILTLNNKVIATLDLESTEKNYRILDIGMTIFQVKPSYNNISYSELASQIVQGYQSLLSLGQEETEQIVTATLYSAASSGLWNLSFEERSEEFLESYCALIRRIKDGFSV